MWLLHLVNKLSAGDGKLGGANDVGSLRIRRKDRWVWLQQYPIPAPKYIKGNFTTSVLERSKGKRCHFFGFDTFAIHLLQIWESSACMCSLWVNSLIFLLVEVFLKSEQGHLDAWQKGAELGFLTEMQKSQYSLSVLELQDHNIPFQNGVCMDFL